MKTKETFKAQVLDVASDIEFLRKKLEELGTGNSQIDKETAIWLDDFKNFLDGMLLDPEKTSLTAKEKEKFQSLRAKAVEIKDHLDDFIKECKQSGGKQNGS